MKRIDRHVLAAFLRDYAVALGVLVGLYVMMDAFFNFDEFTADRGEVGSTWAFLRQVGAYYAAQGLFVYGQLAGVIPVVAAAFTLMRMSRFNELTALLAAGVPLLRVAAPVVIASLVINLIVQPLNQEVIVPRLSGWLTLERGDAVAGAAGGHPVRAMPTGDGGLFDAGRFTPAVSGRPATAEFVTVVSRDGGGPVSLLTARRATWDPIERRWLLEDGRLAGDVGGDLGPVGRRAVQVWDASLSPADVGLFRAADLSVGAGGSYFDLLSTRQLNALLARPGGGSAATADLLRAKHARLAGHVMNLVLMLLAVPAVLTREPGQLRRAAGRTLVVIGLAMAAVFLCQTVARDPPAGLSAEVAGRWPALMAWLPVFTFGPAAVLMLDRMKS